MATQQSSRKSGSSHGKSPGGKGGSSSAHKTRNGSRGQSGRGASARHGRQSERGSGRSKSRREESGSGQLQEQGDGGAGGLKGAGSKMVDSVKQHPFAASAIGVGIAAGLTYMAVRAFRGGGSQDQEDGQQDQDADEGDAQMSSQREGEEDEGGDDEEGGEEDDEEDPGLMSRTRDALGSGVGSLWENHPLAVGAGILGVGLAAGMLLPSTRSEKRLFGGTSGKLTGRLRSAGQELFDQGKEIASKVMSETTDTLREEAEREGLTPDRLSRKVKRIASKVKDAVVNAATD
jgi:hypothetical protein